MTSTLPYLLREISKRPPAFLLRRSRDAVAHRVRSLAVRCGLDPYQGHGFHRETAAVGSLLDLSFLDGVLEDHRTASEKAALLKRAEDVVAGRRRIFGHDFVLEPGSPWNRDFVSGLDWPCRFHTRYRYSELLDLERPSDVKVPWELGRLQDLPALATAYRVSGDERYVQEVGRLFHAWRSSNPVGYGIQWVVGMEVALRAISLILTAELLADRQETGFADGVLFRSLEEHGRFLFRNIEYSDINGNHYTSCLLGLLYLGTWLEGARESRRWTTLAVRELRREIVAQTYPDGVCHEGSVPYHRLVAELFLHALVVARRRDIDLGSAFSERLGRMLEFTTAYTSPTGEAPVWGDADDGRVHRLGAQGINDHRYLLVAGAAILGRGDLLPRDVPYIPLDAALLLQERDWPPKDCPQQREACTLFPQSGYAVLRTDEDDWCFFDCADVGLRGRGGHGHADALSIELVLGGSPVVQDVGCASYTRSTEDRVRSLSAESHNAPVVDGTEPAPLSMVRFPHASSYPVKLIEERVGSGQITGSHFAYPALDPEIGDCTREIQLTRGRLEIRDWIGGNELPHLLTWTFHLSERWTARRSHGGSVELLDEESEPGVLIRADRADAVWTITDSIRWPTYDCPRRTQRARVSLETTLPAEILFVFERL